MEIPGRKVDSYCSPRWSRLDWMAMLFVLAVIFTALTPFAFLWRGTFHDDLAYFYYPNSIFMARNLQNNVIPLWDPHTLGGGLPFYGRYEVNPLYLPLWFFLRAADLSTLRSSYVGTVVLPIIFHFFLGTVFAYLWGRIGVGLEPWGASALALVFGLSASMYRSIPTPSMIFTVSWIPGMLLFQTLHARTGKTIPLALGGLTFGLLAPSWAIYTVHVIFISGVLAILLMVRQLQMRQLRAAFRAIWGPAVMGIIGVLLAGGFWWALIEGFRDMSPYYSFSLDMISGGHNSLPFRYLVTLLVPSLFAEADFSHVWNVVLRDNLFLSEAFLTRGLPLMFLAFVAVSGLWFRKGEKWLNLRSWMVTALVLFLLGLLMMLGRYTPVFKALYYFCPLLRVPYAVRWHTIYTVGLSLLVGLGISGIRLSSGDDDLLTFKGFKLFTVLTLVSVIAATTLPLNMGDKHWDSAWKQLVELGYGGWFLRGPGLYLVACLVFLGVFTRMHRRRWALPLLLIVIIAELGIFMYRNTFEPWQIRWDADKPTLTKYMGPWDDPLLEFGRTHPVPESYPWGATRTAYYRATLSNTCLLNGGFAVLGWPAKPLVPRLNEVLNRFCSGFPHELLVESFDHRFFANMSAGSVWIDRRGRGGKVRDAVPWTTCQGYIGMKYANPVPRLFTLEHICAAPPEEQREALINDDLTGRVWVDPAHPLFAGRCDPPVSRDYFNKLQEKNRILDFEVGHPNRLTAEIEVELPSMLVCTDVYAPGWRAWVDGIPAPLYRVNYIQRGIWLERGRHRVEMRFWPKAMTAWIVSGSLGLVIVIGLLTAGVRARIRISKKNEGPG